MKTIDVNAKQWWDKINGNSYFSAVVTVDYALPTEKQIKVPFQYGYGDSYEQGAFTALQESGIYTGNARQLWGLRDEGVIIRKDIEKGCKKRDVVEFGK